MKGLLDYACGQGLCQDHAAARDLFDSRLMGALTPFPGRFSPVSARYAEDPASATSWYYQVCQDTNYIRRDRVAKQLHWTSRSPYGTLDLTFHPEEHCSRVGRQNDRPLPPDSRGRIGSSGMLQTHTIKNTAPSFPPGLLPWPLTPPVSPNFWVCRAIPSLFSGLQCRIVLIGHPCFGTGTLPGGPV